MGVDSNLVNLRTREYIDVRGFDRFTQEEIREALRTRDSTRALVLRYTWRPPTRDPEPYRQWLTNLLLDFSSRGGATPDDISMCSDNRYDEDPSWSEVIDGYLRIGDIYGFDPANPARLYPT